MIKHLKLSFFALLMSAVAFSGCKKEEQQEEQTIDFKFKAETSLSSGTTTSAVPSVEWTYAWLNLASFDVKLKNSGTVVGGNAMEGLWNVNMLADNNDLFTITFRTYNKFDEIDGILYLKPSAEHPPLTLKALVTLPSGAVVPVEFYFNDEAALHINVKNLWAKIRRDNYIAVVKMEVNKLFAAMDFSKLPTATPTGNKIIISPTSNTELYKQLKNALNSSYTVSFE
ncbi:hypothetical protein [Desertivirga arenae]|uniref:hypothetical protein n=1 Tax=Desertivirga arenae TaxID=2810309 RepID=UPI001A96EEF9|nr:hypothetical protein [Pedobacter sp. SYSU D00823]